MWFGSDVVYAFFMWFMYDAPTVTAFGGLRVSFVCFIFDMVLSSFV
jgi:hypothetical protein